MDCWTFTADAPIGALKLKAAVVVVVFPVEAKSLIGLTSIGVLVRPLE